MTEQRLDDADVDPILEEVRREAVSQRVRPEPMLDEPRFSLPRGPVNHTTMQYATGARPAPMTWKRYLHELNPDDHKIAVRGDVSVADLGELCEADIEVMDEVWREVGWMNEHALCAWTHDPANVPEWQNPKGGRLAISLSRIMAETGLADPDEMARDFSARSTLGMKADAR